MVQLKIREHFFRFERPVIMGILNVTTDSFFDGGQYCNEESIINRCNTLLNDGSDIIDIGAQSTRPGFETVSSEEESARLVPAIKLIRRQFPDIIISADTFRKDVAEQAVEAGVDIVNDVSGGTFDKEMLTFIGSHQVPYILTHNEKIHSLDVHKEVREFFRQQTEFLLKYGEQQIILDPGIGFGKTTEENFRLLTDLDRYRIDGYPILIGVSRKSLIFKTLNATAQEALNGTTVLNTISLMNGADILRVHDAREASETVKLFMKIKNGGTETKPDSATQTKIYKFILP